MKNTVLHISKFIAAIVLFGALALGLNHNALAAPQSSGTIKVNTTADSNSKDSVLTLREAIMISNGGTSYTGLNRTLSDGEKAQLTNCAVAGSANNWSIVAGGGCVAGVSDFIYFSLGACPCGIILSTYLPAIEDAVTIDGYSAPGAVPNTSKKGMNAKIMIQLRGSSAGFYVNGLVIYGNDSTIRGLAIYGFDGYGLLIQGFRNHVEGNLIYQNGTGGILSTGQDNVFGSFAVAGRNAIYQNNQIGIEIMDAATSNPVVNNLIGIGPSGGNVATGNGGDGVVVHSSLVYVTQNRIAFNHGNGAVVVSGTQDWFDGNSIFKNSKLGIDLGNNGVTTNNPGDGWQDYPVLKSAASATKTVKGKVKGKANASIFVELYSTASCDSSAYGEGKKYLGHVWVTTDATGLGKFTTVVKRFKPGSAISATANDTLGNNSEFSKCLTAN